MKVQAVFALVCAVNTLGLPTQSEDDENKLRFLYFPNPDDKVEIEFNDTWSLRASNLKPATKTLLLLDGFTSFADTPMNLETKDTFSGRPDLNVIVVDWSVYSGFGRPIETPEQGMELYFHVLLNEVPQAAGDLAEFIEFISVNNGISYSNVTIIGHSMGAHTAAATGRATQSLYNQTVGRIIGQDPALQISEIDEPYRLRTGDAEVVEVYVTNRLFAGDIHHAIGDVSIFVNGGDYQPCEQKKLGILCDDHPYSYKLYNYLARNETVKACPCMGAACFCYGCEMECGDTGISTGPHIPASARGSYHVKTGLLN